MVSKFQFTSATDDAEAVPNTENDMSFPEVDRHWNKITRHNKVRQGLRIYCTPKLDARFKVTVPKFTIQIWKVTERKARVAGVKFDRETARIIGERLIKFADTGE